MSAKTERRVMRRHSMRKCSVCKIPIAWQFNYCSISCAAHALGKQPKRRKE